MASLHFESTGSGKPILALHGYGASLFSWRHLPPAVPDRRVIRVDLPGHGGSPAPADGRYGLADHAAKIIDFIAEQKLEEFDLIGHSFGGGVALMIALDLMERRPGSISSLTLLDSLALPQRLPGFLMVANFPRIGPALLPHLPARLMVGAVLRSVFHDRRRITEEAIDIYARNLATKERRHALLETARHIIPDDVPRLVERYHRLKQPTLLIWGRQDKIVRPSTAITLNAMIEGSKLIMIDDCGHAPQEERPEIAMPAIRDFLATPGKPA
ncbi:MAG: alpha/beta fold hydrolase [Methylocella sp.]